MNVPYDGLSLVPFISYYFDFQTERIWNSENHLRRNAVNVILEHIEFIISIKLLFNQAFAIGCRVTSNEKNAIYEIDIAQMTG